MKKLLTILSTTLMILTLVGCNTNKEEPTILDEPINQEEDETILGGFTEAEDKSLNDELISIFNKACEGQVGISLTPERLEGTQEVAGINYKFLATGVKTTNPPIRGSYLVTIYKDLEGNCSIADIETVTESEDNIEGDIANYNYWVVFYNPDGNELQRTAQKLGTTPVYEGEEPYYWDADYWYRFICWTDKEGNEIKEFTPITGNTYIYAKYEIGGENKPEPAPEPSNTCTIAFKLDKDLDVEVGKIQNASGDKVTSITVPKGTEFSSSGNDITIGGIVLTVVANSGFAFHSFDPSSGTITSDTTINVYFSQLPPD